MPNVTGKLLDIGLSPIDDLRPVVVFTPKNESGDGSSVNASEIFTNRPISVRPDIGGSFTVRLATTTTLRPETWYEIRIEWFEPTGGFVGAAYPAFRLRVPPEGGMLPALVDAEPTSRLTWVGPNPPRDETPYLWWIDNGSVPPVLYESN